MYFNLKRKKIKKRYLNLSSFNFEYLLLINIIIYLFEIKFVFPLFSKKIALIS
jgi:hypothetical protein